MATAHVLELENDQLLLIVVLNKDQLTNGVHAVYEPLSRSWRGQYQPFAKAIVEASDRYLGKGQG